MSDTSVPRDQTAILRLFQRVSDGRISAADLKRKLTHPPKTGQELLTADQARDALAAVVDRGFVRVTGGGRDGDHPRPKASYRLTEEGRAHLRPSRPEGVSGQLLEAQESFILLQFARVEGHRLSRADLNGKLKTKTAWQQLELQPTEHPEVIDFHLATLVEAGALGREIKGVSTAYTLEPSSGMQRLVSSRQHDGATFTISGPLLNALLAAARGVAPLGTDPSDRETDLADEPRFYAEERVMSREDIQAAIEELRRGTYRGEDLVPVHEVRRWVAQHLGADAASHARFDPLLMEMRSDRALKLIAISDRRMATDDEVRDAIPGVNETLFYINVE